MKKLLRTYGTVGLLWLLCDKLYTLLFFSKCRLVRFRCRVRGAKYISWGMGLTTGVGCRIDAFCHGKRPAIRFGRNVQINDYVHLAAVDSITIGNETLLASRVTVIDHDHGTYKGQTQSSPTEAPAMRSLSASSITIGSNVWIGEGAVILPGTSLGNGCVVGANAVVKGTIPDNSMVVGVPGRIIRQFSRKSMLWEKYY